MTNDAQQRVEQVGLKHLDDNPSQQQYAAEYLHQRVAERLLDRLRVIGDAAHQVACLTLGVEPQRQPVQVGEQVHAHLAQGVLASPTHRIEHQAAGDRPANVQQ